MAMDDPTVVAQALVLEGRTAEAESLYRKVLGERPDDIEALEGLGTLVLQQGRPDQAVALLTRRLATPPDTARLRANLGEALRILGRLDQSLEHLRRATELDPAFTQPWNSLGLLAHVRGHFEYAETAYREVLRLRPNYAPGHINLANTLLARGRVAEACGELRRALEIEPNHAVALMNLGRVLAELRDPDRFDEAEAMSRRAVDLMPSLPYAMINLGHVLRIRGREAEARACDARARELATGQAATPARGASVPPRQQTLQASDVRVAADASASAEARHAEGVVSFKAGRLDDAEASFHEAVRIAPTQSASWLGLARIRRERGDFERACRAARSALAVSPGLAEAYDVLASILGEHLPDDEFRAMQGLLDDPAVSPDSRALLRFGLAAVLDRRGQFAESAAHLEVANELQSASKAMRGLTTEVDRAALLLDRVIAAFTPEFFARSRGWGDPDPRPVFVVGLPRSGTTLTEQILGSHPGVHGAGELHEVSRVFGSLSEKIGDPAADPFDALARLTPDSARAAARSYLERLDELAPPTALRVVDKQPDNIDHLGLISVLWPGARVIHCRRDLRDVALSCWQTGLATNPWVNDWDRIARRFANYQRVVEHWERTRPIEWLDVSYELLVGDLEGQARRMTAFLGLEWDPACLEFHSNPRIVRTPSLVQVRRPIHARSVGRWRNYEPFIQPLFRAFERHGVRLT